MFRLFKRYNVKDEILHVLFMNNNKTRAQRYMSKLNFTTKHSMIVFTLISLIIMLSKRGSRKEKKEGMIMD